LKGKDFPLQSRASDTRLRVVFLIVTWNRKEILRRCLDSLRANISLPHSVLVVDNASTDGTAVLLEAEYPQVFLLRNKANEGFGRAVNRGLDWLGEGEILFDYVVFLNDDAEFRDGSIQKLIDYLESTPAVRAALPSVFSGPGRLQAGAGGYALSLKTAVSYAFGLAILFPAFFKGFFFHQPYFQKRGIILSLDWVSGVCLVLRRAGVESLRFPEDFFMYAEDAAFCRAVKAHGEIIYFPRAQVYHWKEERGGAGSSVLWLDSLFAYYGMIPGGKSPIKQRLMKFVFFCGFLLRSWGYRLKGLWSRTDYTAKSTELRRWARYIRKGKTG
jgi:GT2 family glycosyltransferase